MPYFDEPVGRVKIQTMSKNSQRFYTSKCLIRGLLSNDLFSQKSNLPSFLTFTRPVGMRQVQISCDICSGFVLFLYWGGGGNPQSSVLKNSDSPDFTLYVSFPPFCFIAIFMDSILIENVQQGFSLLYSYLCSKSTSSQSFCK